MGFVCVWGGGGVSGVCEWGLGWVLRVEFVSGVWGGVCEWSL